MTAGRLATIVRGYDRAPQGDVHLPDPGHRSRPGPRLLLRHARSVYLAASAAGILVDLGGGSRILLYQSPGGDQPTHTVAGWEVPELEPIIERLQAAGVVFEDYDLPGLRTEGHIAWIGPERAAWFRDSEGNVLAISEPWTERR